MKQYGKKLLLNPERVVAIVWSFKKGWAENASGINIEQDTDEIGKAHVFMDTGNAIAIENLPDELQELYDEFGK